MRDGVGMGSRGATREGGTRGTRARDARLRVRAVGARAGACGELAWGGGEGRGPKRTAVKHPPPPHVRAGIQMARLTVMASFWQG